MFIVKDVYWKCIPQIEQHLHNKIFIMFRVFFTQPQQNINIKSIY